MSSKMKQYNSIDAMKFISAVLIIILHTSPFASYSNLISYGLRNIVTIIAVPFFFCASGFILFKKLSLMNNSTDKSVYFKKYIKRLCIMYLIWTAVYLPFVIYGWTENGFSGYELLQYIKRFFFEGSYSTIWFLPALIVAACFCYFLHKKTLSGKYFAWLRHFIYLLV